MIIGLSPSGKAMDSDSIIRRFESYQPSLSFTDRIRLFQKAWFYFFSLNGLSKLLDTTHIRLNIEHLNKKTPFKITNGVFKISTNHQERQDILVKGVLRLCLIPLHRLCRHLAAQSPTDYQGIQ